MRHQLELPLAVRLWKAVEDRYDVFPAADDGRVFAVSKTLGGVVELVSSGFVIRATRDIGGSYARFSTAATKAAKTLTVLAALNEPRVLWLVGSHNEVIPEEASREAR